ncbi:MAG TPA: ABC transporter ATP-binding protein [Acidimicrobiales bacterium]|nr:ABC transporter ATP-binding protein [Acidimicrobiales bacterium]
MPSSHGTVAVEVAQVSKRFRLYHEKYTSLKERFIHLGRIPHEDFWALRDINLEIREGETVGLLGHNGSGKSTLLKCIAGILQPTTGIIKVRGRLAALLELGAGFQPELSGRDNIFLNASLLGLSRREVERRFDAIVAFAELEQFIDNQVKYYSSGMYVRLGFAVAVHMDPDILLVDEVLAVGDENFQRKCLDRVRQFQREGRTIIFVSHSPDLVRQICDWAAVLDQGDMVAAGAPGEAIRSFREHLLERQRFAEARELELQLQQGGEEAQGERPEVTGQEARRNLEVRITQVSFEYEGCEERPYVLPGQTLIVRVGYEAPVRVDDVVVGLGVYDLEGRFVFGASTEGSGVDAGPVEGGAEVAFTFDQIPLLDGTFLVSVGVHSQDQGTVYDWTDQRHQFEVMNPGGYPGVVHAPFRVTRRDQPLATEPATEVSAR